MQYDYLKAVDEIERRYPPERIARSRARLAATWNLRRADAIPFVYSSVPDSTGADPNNLYEARYRREELLAYQLDQILAHAAVDDDYIPSLFPGCRQGVLPTAYGAREEWTGDHYWLTPMLADATEARDLKQPDFTTEGIAADLLETTRFFRRATAGRLPIQMPDMQGPLDLAANMLGSEQLIMDMCDYPDAVHHLMDQMTDDFIKYMHLQEEASEGTLVPIHCLPTVWMPPGRAMSLSDDLLAVISPRLYEQFAVPYNERIAAEFGGVVIHSCGSWEHNLPPVARTKGLLGVNFGVSETSIERVAEQFGNKAVILPHCDTTVTCNERQRYPAREFAEFVFDFVKERDLRAIILLVPNPEITADECVDIARLARERAAWQV